MSDPPSAAGAVQPTAAGSATGGQTLTSHPLSGTADGGGTVNGAGGTDMEPYPPPLHREEKAGNGEAAGELGPGGEDVGSGGGRLSGSDGSGAGSSGNGSGAGSPTGGSPTGGSPTGGSPTEPTHRFSEGGGGGGNDADGDGHGHDDDELLIRADRPAVEAVMITYMADDADQEAAAGIEAATEIHDTAVEDAIRQFNGQRVQRMSRGYAAVFEYTMDALMCGLQIQNMLLCAKWPDGLPLQVATKDNERRLPGLGVTTAVFGGEILNGDGSLTRRSMGTASAMARSGASGQMLVNEQAFNIYIANCAEEDTARVRELGAFNILKRTTNIYQILPLVLEGRMFGPLNLQEANFDFDDDDSDEFYRGDGADGDGSAFGSGAVSGGGGGTSGGVGAGVGTGSVSGARHDASHDDGASADDEYSDEWGDEYDPVFTQVHTRVGDMETALGGLLGEVVYVREQLETYRAYSRRLQEHLKVHFETTEDMFDYLFSLANENTRLRKELKRAKRLEKDARKEAAEAVAAAIEAQGAEVEAPTVIDRFDLGDNDAATDGSATTSSEGPSEMGDYPGIDLSFRDSSMARPVEFEASGEVSGDDGSADEGSGGPEGGDLAGADLTGASDGTDRFLSTNSDA